MNNAELNEKFKSGWIKLRFKPKWITKSIEKECIEFAQDLAISLCGKVFLDKKSRTLRYKNYVGGDSMTTNQIRNYFNEVRRIEQLDRNERKTPFLLLKPKLAYAVAKEKNHSKIKEFKEVMDLAYDALVYSESEDKYGNIFQNYVDFLEAILAYHKSEGGKDKKY